MKLYEILLRKAGVGQTPKPAEPAPEDQIYNPVGCRLSGVVKMDCLDLRDHRFTVKEILEYTVREEETDYQIVDYVLLSRPVGQPDFTVRLRAVPDPDSKSKVTHRTLVMSLYDSGAYNKDLEDVVRDDTKKFVIDDNDDPKNPVHDEFWRVNDVVKSYLANVKSVVGTMDTEVEFWDYSRITPIDGVDTEEFVFVEMNKADGWFQIWRGTEVNPESIDVF